MPIGETLAQARRRAGLTVAQVSERTRIREAVIEGIEGGDYSACGGDFYARANIRSIAKAVGADSGQLISEYDALYRERGPLSAVSLDELLAMSIPAASIPAAQPRQPDLPAEGGLVAAGDVPAGRRAVPPAAPRYRPRGRWLSWIVVLGLLAAVGFGVYSRFSGPRHAAAVPPAAGRHAVTHQPAGPGGPTPAPKLTHAAATPAPAPQPTHVATTPAPAAAAPAHTTAPAGAAEPAPGGGASPTHGATGSSRATGGSSAAGGGSAPAPARRPDHRRPLTEPVPRQEPAPGPALSGHDHRGPGHHRRRAADGHEARAGSGQLPDTRYDAGPERYA